MKKFTYFLSLALSFVGLTAAGQTPTFSTAPSNGEFDADTHWYLIQNAKDFYISTGDGYTDADGNLYASNTTRPGGDAALWCIVGDASSGYKFYNKAGGATQHLAVSGSEADARFHLYTDEAIATANEDSTTVYDAFYFNNSTVSAGDDGLSYTVITIQGSANNNWNPRGTYLALWNYNAPADQGNGWKFIEADSYARTAAQEAYDELEALVASNAASTYTYFNYEQEPLAALAAEKTVPETGTTDDYMAYIADLQSAIAALPRITIPNGTRMLISSNGTSTDYVSATDKGLMHPTGRDWSSVWTLTTDDEGSTYRLFNSYSDKYVGAIPSANETVVPLTDDATQAGVFTISQSPNADFYVIKNATAADGCSYMHMASGNRMVIWYASQENTQLSFLPYTDDLAEELSAGILSSLEGITFDALGYLKSSEAFNTALATLKATPSEENCKAAYAALPTEYCMPEADKLYTIRNARGTEYSLFEKYDQLTSGNYTLYCGTPTANAAALWRFVTYEGSDNGNGLPLYKLQNVNSGKFVHLVTWGQTVYLEDEGDTNGAFDIFTNGFGDATLPTAISFLDTKVTGHDGTLTVGGSDNSSTTGTLATYKAAGYQNLFDVSEAQDIDITIGATGYATLHLPFAVTLPSGVTAYTGTDKEETIELTPLTTSVIPAHTPVILQASVEEDTPFTFTIAYDDATEAPAANDLTGALDPVTVTAAYTLQNGSGGVGLYPLSSDDMTIGANEAYLTKADDATADYKALTLVDNTATALRSATADSALIGTLYDLNGRPVAYPSRGIYVTAGGQKIFVK